MLRTLKKLQINDINCGLDKPHILSRVG